VQDTRKAAGFQVSDRIDPFTPTSSHRVIRAGQSSSEETTPTRPALAITAVETDGDVEWCCAAARRHVPSPSVPDSTRTAATLVEVTIHGAATDV
jgi:hypothetical protein